MTIERYVEQVPQSADQVPKQLPLERGPGNFLLFQTSNALVNITLLYDGVREVFANVNGGVYVRRVKPWSNLRIDGAIGTQCTFFYGSEVTDKDETDIRLQVATIAGSVFTQDQPAATLVDNPAVVCVANTNAALVPANLNRRRVTISADPNNTATVFLRVHNGLNNLLPVSPGAVIQIGGTYAIDYSNQNGVATPTLYIFEEQ